METTCWELVPCYNDWKGVCVLRSFSRDRLCACVYVTATVRMHAWLCRCSSICTSMSLWCIHVWMTLCLCTRVAVLVRALIVKSRLQTTQYQTKLINEEGASGFRCHFHFVITLPALCLHSPLYCEPRTTLTTCLGDGWDTRQQWLENSCPWWPACSMRFSDWRANVGELSSLKVSTHRNSCDLLALMPQPAVGTSSIVEGNLTSR